jgi:hypothetical protein
MEHSELLKCTRPCRQTGNKVYEQVLFSPCVVLDSQAEYPYSYFLTVID